jgi:hypothetical protein
MLKALNRRWWLFTLSRITIVLACAASVTNGAVGDESESGIYRIEEDWEMKLKEPSALQNSPQVTFFMKPDPQNDAAYFQLQMNHAIGSEYSSGGFHVAAVLNEAYYDEARSGTRQGLSVDTDTITWTNMIAIVDQKLFFAVKNGYCSDWGAFGGPEYLVQMPAGDVSSLNAYQAEKSIADLDVGYGGNRVLTLELKTVRAYYRNGEVETTEVNRLVER